MDIIYGKEKMLPRVAEAEALERSLAWRDRCKSGQVIFK